MKVSAFVLSVRFGRVGVRPRFFPGSTAI